MHLLRWGTYLIMISVANLAFSELPDSEQAVATSGSVDNFQWQPSVVKKFSTLPSSHRDQDLDFQALVSRGSHVLPNDHGQVWREYDIRGYTSRVVTEKPQQAIVDWILRETGTELWFSEPLGILSASQEILRVYHTPQIQEMVASVLSRFLATETAMHSFGMRLITIGSPNWRAKALPTMIPVTVQTPGMEAWLLSKEEAAILLNDLRQRNDYREHGSPNLRIDNGQQETIEQYSPQQYVRSVIYRQHVWPGYALDIGQIQQGFSLQLTPLMSPDGQMVDAVIRAQVEQIEKMEEVVVEVPTTATLRQPVKIQIPRLSGWQLHERFRWPADRVLVISRGMVATPATGQAKPFFRKNPLTAGRLRGDALLFLDCKGPVQTKIASGKRRVRSEVPSRF